MVGKHTFIFEGSGDLTLNFGKFISAISLRNVVSYITGFDSSISAYELITIEWLFLVTSLAISSITSLASVNEDNSPLLIYTIRASDGFCLISEEKTWIKSIKIIANYLPLNWISNRNLRQKVLISFKQKIILRFISHHYLRTGFGNGS